MIDIGPIYRTYCKNINMHPSKDTLNNLIGFTSVLGKDMVTVAISLASLFATKNPEHYLFSMLNKWYNAGFREVEQVLLRQTPITVDYVLKNKENIHIGNNYMLAPMPNETTE